MKTPSPEPAGEPLIPWLLAYDFALAEESGQSSESVPLDLTFHVEQVKSCLRLLDEVWPHSRPRSPTRPDVGGAVTTPGDELRPAGAASRLQVPGFDIEREIARGGMGVVYKARQQSLDRIVAIKCLPPAFAQDSNRLARFRREARAAAKLVNKGILPVYDVLEAGGVPLLVMPYIEGSDLARIIADRLAVRQGEQPRQPHPWATLSDAEYQARMLAVLDKVVESLTLLHRAEVVHRDIKPSNILVDQDGHAWLSDFGLARLGKPEGLTVAGQGLGTPGYMSPEQWDGSETVDGRTDVFSMGVMLYQALTLVLPYGRERLSRDTRLPAPPSKHQPLLPAGMDAVVLRALAPDLRDRYGGAAELQEDWDRVRTGMPPRRKAPQAWRQLLRPRWRVLAGAAVILVALFAGLHWMSNPEVESEQPAAPVLRTVTITTEPPGADIVFVPLDPHYGEPDPENAVRPEGSQKTPCKLELAPGHYFVEAQMPDGRFHQVYRYVPRPGEHVGQFFHNSVLVCPQERWEKLADGVIALAAIHIPEPDVSRNMARLAGGNFMLGSMDPGLGASQLPHVVTLPPYYLDTREVTEKDYLTVQKKSGMAQVLHLATSKRSEREDLLPPGLSDRPRGDAFPVIYIELRDAMAWAERAGKRLPTEAEYEYAATNGGTTRFPWGNGDEPLKEAWTFGPAGEPTWDRTKGNPPIFGLYSNVAEWTCTWRLQYPGKPEPETPGILPGDTRVIRGGPSSVADGRPAWAQYHLGPRQRFHLQVQQRMPGLGFRCARSERPMFLGTR